MSGKTTGVDAIAAVTGWKLTSSGTDVGTYAAGT
ncbi:MAG: hypothetical protein H6P95_2603, partial [Candidatus Aminicenantes bacterium]|nr:hypothetical protein [Candidatus Aminicenantes bacterium]